MKFHYRQINLPNGKTLTFRLGSLARYVECRVALPYDESLNGAPMFDALHTRRRPMPANPETSRFSVGDVIDVNTHFRQIVCAVLPDHLLVSSYERHLIGKPPQFRAFYPAEIPYITIAGKCANPPECNFQRKLL